MTPLIVVPIIVVLGTIIVLEEQFGKRELATTEVVLEEAATIILTPNRF